jgi:hypothetical protein
MKTPRSYAHRLRMGRIFTHSCSILCASATSRDAKGGVVHRMDELIGISLILLRCVSPKSLLISGDQILREMTCFHADPNQFICLVHQSIIDGGYISGVPIKGRISLPDGRCGKLNQRMFSVWRGLTIVLKNPFESLHPVLEVAL